MGVLSPFVYRRMIRGVAAPKQAVEKSSLGTGLERGREKADFAIQDGARQE
jgi:hypothetical protein